MRELSKSENYLTPLRAENQKLVKENNELHYSMMKLKEETEFKSKLLFFINVKKDNRWKTQYNTLEGDKKDLKFLAE